MKQIKCTVCGANELQKIDGFYVCSFCGTKHVLTEEEYLKADSTINLNEDVVRVLHRWKDDPANGKKYAQLILQIDPSNEKAKKELEQYKSQGGCYIATAVYGTYDCPQVWTLRRYRDFVLAKSYRGRLFILLYYSISPTLVKLFADKKWFHAVFKKWLDYIVRTLNVKGIDSGPYIEKYSKKEKPILLDWVKNKI